MTIVSPALRGFALRSGIGRNSNAFSLTARATASNYLKSSEIA
jgi:hypothetical protein